MEIVLDILGLVQQGKSRFRILVEAQLNSYQLKQYLDSLIKLGLIEERPVNKRKIYFTTKKGDDFLKQYGNLSNFLNNQSDH